MPTRVKVIPPNVEPTCVPYPPAGMPVDRWDALTLLAATVLGEAEGECRSGKLAVASVILERVRDPRWPGSVHGVCLQPWQFSCWNSNSPRIATMMAPRKRTSAAVWLDCFSAASSQFFNLQVSPVPGANHYCTTEVVERTSWARGRPPSGVIGLHSFFRL